MKKLFLVLMLTYSLLGLTTKEMESVADYCVKTTEKVFDTSTTAELYLWKGPMALDITDRRLVYYIRCQAVIEEYQKRVLELAKEKMKDMKSLKSDFDFTVPIIKGRK